MDTIIYIGKEGITPNIVKQVYDALEARELIKCSVQNSAPMDAREACQTLCGQTGAEPVQCIGGRFVIYRQSRENQKIVFE
jgi:RNA-binding protein